MPLGFNTNHGFLKISFLSLVKNCNHKGLGIYYLLSAFIFGIHFQLIHLLEQVFLNYFLFLEDLPIFFQTRNPKMCPVKCCILIIMPEIKLQLLHETLFMDTYPSTSDKTSYWCWLQTLFMVLTAQTPTEKWDPVSGAPCNSQEHCLYGRCLYHLWRPNKRRSTTHTLGYKTLITLPSGYLKDTGIFPSPCSSYFLS